MDHSIVKGFSETFGVSPTHRIFSPGRVNLIGEHTDYSGGVVFPMALSLGINGAYRARDDLKIRLFSTAFKDLGVLEVDHDELSYKKGFSYGNYVQGVIWALKEEGLAITRGFELYLDSSLPASAGVSSSAALEMAILGVIDSLEGYSLDPLRSVKLAKKVENDYMGIASGIMDQFAVRYGKAGHAIYLDTATLDYAYAPFPLKDHVLYLMNTNKTRDLETSDYNERFDSVRKGMNHARSELGVSHLGEVSPTDFERLSDSFESDTVKRRVRHVVFENERTRQARFALESLDFKSFGELMTASHVSLRDDFEVSCAELDFLVEEALSKGALGARMTGAGFGGTMIALYEADHVPKDLDALRTRYETRFGKKLEIYQASSSDGVFFEKVGLK